MRLHRSLVVLPHGPGGSAADWTCTLQRTYLGTGKLAELATELAELKPDTGTQGCLSHRFCAAALPAPDQRAGVRSHL